VLITIEDLHYNGTIAGAGARHAEKPLLLVRRLADGDRWRAAAHRSPAARS
jgi:hypothetical protein